MAESWVTIADKSDIPNGLTPYRKKRKSIAVLKENDEIIRVFEDNCPHNQKIKISEDYILKNETIICRFHGACWKIENGETVKGPGKDGLKIYTHRINDKGKLEVLLG